MITTDILDKTGTTLVTKEFQRLIDFASLDDGTLLIKTGKYLVSSIFLKSNMNIIFEAGAEIIATTIDNEYPIMDTRVAGIEMPWYVGVVNIINCNNVTIKGEGFINGSGPYWWSKYWGADMLGGMRKVYDSKGMRWAADYDCMRPRNLYICNSNNIVINDITMKESGFWNLHVLYSNNITINNISVLSENKNSPSTDGIDIDSSNDVLIKNCLINCNDDCISIKSGRDYDGLRVNKPSYNITIEDCKMLNGYGITIGSEVSGGIYNVQVNNIEFVNTDCGFRIKSSKPRKGYIRDINILNLKMKNVKYLFHIYLNWNPNYSICKMPKDYDGRILPHYDVLCHTIDSKYANTKVDNIKIKNVISSNDDNYTGISRIFNIEGFEDSNVNNISFENMNIISKEYGIINYASNISFKDCTFTSSDKHDKANDVFDAR